MKHIIRQHLRKAVIVTLKSGDTFSGVLFDADSESVVLRIAQMVDNRSGMVPVDGELVFLRPDIAYMQYV